MTKERYIEGDNLRMIKASLVEIERQLDLVSDHTDATDEEFLWFLRLVRDELQDFTNEVADKAENWALEIGEE